MRIIACSYKWSSNTLARNQLRRKGLTLLLNTAEAKLGFKPTYFLYEHRVDFEAALGYLTFTVAEPGSKKDYQTLGHMMGEMFHCHFRPMDQLVDDLMTYKRSIVSICETGFHFFH